MRAEEFHTGPLIENFGYVTVVAGREAIPDNAVFKVSFDIAEMAQPGTLNRSLVTGARFLNMHTEAGVKAENLSVALVVHGKAVQDLTIDTHYKALTGKANANRALVAALLAQGVQLSVCGQSAVFHKIKAEDLLPGIDLSLSAMTAHALLQQQGYTLNPF